MLKEIWLVQPLAFARGGGSPIPCDAFDWAGPDLSPDGSGRTIVVPADTLVVDPETGAVTLKPAASIDEIIFKDAQGIRPVCPFFELHGAWELDGKTYEGALTPAILAACGKSPADLIWRVEFQNGKAAHWTQNDSDRVAVTVGLFGDQYAPVELLGTSTGANPLALPEKPVPLGRVQLTRPTAEFPEFRLRFTPGQGRAYAPANLKERIAALWQPGPGDKKPDDMLDTVWAMFQQNAIWKGFELPPEQCILNPDASWPNYALFREGNVGPSVIGRIDSLVTLETLAGDPSQLLRFLLAAVGIYDVRNLPPGLYARATEGSPADPFPDWVTNRMFASLGMIDDYGDGVISCTIAGVGTAMARVVSGPPDFAPDRRPPVSLADGLADRVLRAEVRDPAWTQGDNAPVTEREIQDLIARAFETVSLANLDATNDYFQAENRNHAVRSVPYAANLDDTAARLWTANTPTGEDALAQVFSGVGLGVSEPFPLTALGRDAHRRNTVALFLRALILKYPDFMERWVRVPATPDRFYDRRMPALMRGGDRMPLHITRRQFDLMCAWVETLKAPAPPPPAA